MIAVAVTEFAKSFDRYEEEAQREPVAITSYGRVSGYFVSASEFKELKRLCKFERRVFRLKDLPPDVAAAIEGSKMDSAHDPLNALLEEEKSKTA